MAQLLVKGSLFSSGLFTKLIVGETGTSCSWLVMPLDLHMPLVESCLISLSLPPPFPAGVLC